jgi:aminopeptidase N
MIRLVAFLLLLVFTVYGEEPFSFEKTPGRLPKNILPKHYAIRIEPDMATETFAGEVAIDIEAKAPVREIILNSLGLSIIDSTVNGKPVTAKADDAEQLLTLSGMELPAGTHKVHLTFAGKLSERTEGLYLTRYQLPTGEQRKALVTQMQATDARRMFPCWDEPAFRSTFQLTAMVPAGHTALYNMPEERERVLGDGRREVVFGTTPPMPSYLVAFASAELEAIEDEVEGVQLRILATPGKREQMRYAMEATKKILPYFNEYFGVKYPLPKLDQVSFPSVAAGGMENWGCIIYADTALLFDPKTSSQNTRERVFGIVAHEIAHQWFGDLVTMAWWDNLWLNEGFASWMATKTTDKFNPSWKMWLRAANSKEYAMRLDARATTHPIQQPVKSEADAMQAFDEITYQKGQAFLRMLETWLGPDSFRDGLRAYFKKHAYGNTTTADLWNALGQVAGKDVRRMAAGWTEQPGFPVVTINEAGLTQSRFTIHQKNPPALKWQIPIAWERWPSRERGMLLLADQPAPLPGGEGAFVVDPIGYYRLSYEGPVWTSLEPHLSNLDESHRLALSQDTWALVQAEKLPLSRWMELALRLREDPSPTVRNHLLEVIQSVDQLLRGTDLRGPFQKWAAEYLDPAFQRTGWKSRGAEEPATAQYRANLIRTLGRFGVSAVLSGARERLDAFLKDPTSLPGDLREPVLHLAGRTADAATWDRLHQLARSTSDTEQKHVLYGALAAAQTPALAERALTISLAGELPARQASRMVSRVAGEGENPEVAWTFAKAKLPELLNLLSANAADEYVASLFRTFSDEARAEELEKFTRENLPPTASKPTAIATDEIRFKAQFKARVQKELAAWLQSPAAKAAPAE